MDGHKNAGGVAEFQRSSTGLTLFKLWTQSFSELGVGLPGRRVRGRKGAGAVLVPSHDGSGADLVTQDTAGVAGSPDAGDHFGATLSGPWIGVPGESLAGGRHAGLVQSWEPGSSTPSISVSQDTAGVLGSVGADHAFGAALAFDDDSATYGGADLDYLFVGAPGDQGGVGSVTGLWPR